MREKWTAMFLREIINIQTKRIPKDLRWPYFQLPVFIPLNTALEWTPTSNKRHTQSEECGVYSRIIRKTSVQLGNLHLPDIYDSISGK